MRLIFPQPGHPEQPLHGLRYYVVIGAGQASAKKKSAAMPRFDNALTDTGSVLQVDSMAL
ncbi:hypothetical protein D3C72_1051420 [compost metagenome]